MHPSHQSNFLQNCHRVEFPHLLSFTVERPKDRGFNKAGYCRFTAAYRTPPFLPSVSHVSRLLSLGFTRRPFLGIAANYTTSCSLLKKLLKLLLKKTDWKRTQVILIKGKQRETSKIICKRSKLNQTNLSKTDASVQNQMNLKLSFRFPYNLFRV